MSARRWPRRLRRAALVLAFTWAAALAGERVLGWLLPYPRERLGIPPQSAIVVDADGTELRWTEAEGERRRWVPLSGISPFVIDALIAAEDRRFRDHSGVDWRAVARAALVDLVQRRRVSGASTLTMQVARLVEPRPRGWLGKIAEAFRARQLERLMGKDEILEQYLNRVPWGGELRGVEAASRRWFAKPSADLGPAEAAALVAMLPAPSRRSPLVDAALLRDRRDRVIAAMPLDATARSRAIAEPLPTTARPFPWLAPHACDAALADGAAADGDGLVRLDILLDEQRRALAAMHACDAPCDGLAAAVVDGDGRVRVHIGSPDWRSAPFDALRARRAAGSTLKPFLYRRAFAGGGLSAGSLIADAPFTAGGWSPANEDGCFLGALPAGEALARSRNPPAARVLAGIGREAFAQELRDVGLGLEVTGLDAALGTGAVQPLALARAYAGLARRARTDAAAAAVLASLRARPIAPDLVPDEAVAWKTGTSSQRRDAWCVAIAGDRAVVVWLGWSDGHGDARLRGRDDARRLCAAIIAALDLAG